MTKQVAAKDLKVGDVYSSTLDQRGQYRVFKIHKVTAKTITVRASLVAKEGTEHEALYNRHNRHALETMVYLWS